MFSTGGVVDEDFDLDDNMCYGGHDSNTYICSKCSSIEANSLCVLSNGVNLELCIAAGDCFYHLDELREAAKAGNEEIRQRSVSFSFLRLGYDCI